jgi:hypothetical protein
MDVLILDCYHQTRKEWFADAHPGGESIFKNQQQFFDI